MTVPEIVRELVDGEWRTTVGSSGGGGGGGDASDVTVDPAVEGQTNVQDALEALAAGGSQPGAVSVAVYEVTAAQVADDWHDAGAGTFRGEVELFTPEAGMFILRAAVLLDVNMLPEDSSDTYYATLIGLPDAAIGGMGWDLSSNNIGVTTDGWTIPSGDAWAGDSPVTSGEAYMPAEAGEAAGAVVARVGLNNADANDPPAVGSFRVVIVSCIPEAP